MRLLNMELEDLKPDYEKQDYDLSILQDNDEFFILVYHFVDYYYIDLELVIDTYFEHEIEECYSILNRFLQESQAAEDL